MEMRLSDWRHWMLAAVLAASGMAVAACDNSGDVQVRDVDEGPAEQQTASAEQDDDYPLTTCVVSGEPLGSMGEPVEYEHEGETVKFCCDGCIGDFEANPDSYMAKLEQGE